MHTFKYVVFIFENINEIGHFICVVATELHSRRHTIQVCRHFSNTKLKTEIKSINSTVFFLSSKQNYKIATNVLVKTIFNNCTKILKNKWVRFMEFLTFLFFTIFGSTHKKDEYK